MRFVDANIAIAVQNAADPFHERVLRLIGETDEQMGLLTVTLAEAIVRPSMVGRGDEAAADLARIFHVSEVTDEMARLAAQLRAGVIGAGLSGRRLPMLDALVLAAGHLGSGVVTTDAEWPMDALDPAPHVEVLTP